jgi:hypothetical protein
MDGSYGVTVSVQEAGLHEISVYPNPAGEVLYIDGLKDPVRIIITDLAGKTIKIFDARRDHAMLDVSALPAGMYLLSVEGQARGAKIIKL